MPDTIIGSTWYTCADAARARGVSEETMRRFYDAIAADNRIPKAYYQGPNEMMLSGYVLRMFVRPPVKPMVEAKPAAKRAHRKRTQ